LKQPLKMSHVKPLMVEHWGTTPGQNFIFVHLNRVIKYTTWTCSKGELHPESVNFPE
jgi:phosphoketolase